MPATIVVCPDCRAGVRIAGIAITDDDAAAFVCPFCRAKFSISFVFTETHDGREWREMPK